MAQSGHPGVSDRCPLMTQCGPRLFGRGIEARAETLESQRGCAVALSARRSWVVTASSPIFFPISLPTIVEKR